MTALWTRRARPTRHFRTLSSDSFEVRKRLADDAAIGHDGGVNADDYARLLLLAAIWGGAFVFLRVAAPVLGPVWTAEFRVLLGGLALLAWLRFTGVEVGLWRHRRFYLEIGRAHV